MNFRELNAQIKPLDLVAREAAGARWSEVARPLGSLGVFEDMLVKIAAVSGGVDIKKRALILLSADNGVVKHGIASTPKEVTVTLTGLMAEGKSCVCIMAKTADTDVIVADMGMFRRIDKPGLLDYHIADGTADLSEGPAMTAEQCERAIAAGLEIVKNAYARGYRLLATGEMGIGNTTTSSAVAAVLLNKPAEDVTGRGAGLSDEAYLRKIEIIKRGIGINRPRGVFDTLRRLGGFDIAGLCGVFIGGALLGVPVIIDGFISAVAALCASRLCPRAKQVMLASHVSAEPAALMIMEELGLNPPIRAGMRLGEGTGAVALIPILDQIIAVYDNMLTFSDIGMSGGVELYKGAAEK